MNLILRKAQKEIEGFGERKLSEVDFYAECSKRDIEVVESRLSACKGMTIWMLGRMIIVIDSSLSGAERLKVLWHEFGHAFLHVPGVSVGAWFCGVECLLTRKQEREVDDFVAVALGYVRTDLWYKKGELR